MKKFIKIFVPSFTLYFILGLVYCYFFKTVDICDMFFNADTPRVVGDMSIVIFNHYRVVVHPLFLILIQVPVQIIDFILNNDILSCLLLQSTFSALSVYLVNNILTRLNINKKITTILMLTFVFSFSQLVFNATIETYMFAETFLLIMYIFIFEKIDKKLTYLDILILIILGVLSLGITLTNYFQFFIALFILIMWNDKNKSILEKFSLFFIINISAVGLGCLLSEIQHLFFNNAPMFFLENLRGIFNGSEESIYISGISLNSIKNQLMNTFGYSFISGPISFTESASKKVIIFDRINLLSICMMTMCLLTSIFLLYQFIKKNIRVLHKHKFIIIIFLSFAFNFLLHLVYGNNSGFLYTGHYVFLMIILFGYLSDNLKLYENEMFMKSLISYLVIELLLNICSFVKIFNYFISFISTVDYINKIPFIVIFLLGFLFLTQINKKVQIKCVMTVILVMFLYTSYSLISNKLNVDIITIPTYVSTERNDSIEKYNQQINLLKDELGVNIMFEDAPSFYLFGMGNRNKLIYKDGVLFNIKTAEVLYNFDVKSELIIPNEYTVVVETKDSEIVTIYEDQNGVNICYDKCQVIEGTSNYVNLPTFDGYKYSEVLKVLHQEILFNIDNNFFKPNIMTYDGIWYRDAMVGTMVLDKTNNLNLIEEGISKITEIYDYQNGAYKPDNLGELLYIYSKSKNNHETMINKIIKEASRIRTDNYISGYVDAINMSYYPTAALIYGLNSLGIEHDYKLPSEEGYNYLSWWLTPNIDKIYSSADNYQYLTWGALHSGNTADLKIATNLYPLSYEKDASKDNPAYLPKYLKYYQDKGTSPTHTWHAAEMFLVLIER